MSAVLDVPADVPADVLKRLSVPFPLADLRWRVGSLAKPKKGEPRRASLMAYIDARAVMWRLDDVMGFGWSDSYRVAPEGGILCRLELRIGDRWVGREDAADRTTFEGTKGGHSDALKRAAVKFGVGRYLYLLDAAWHTVKDGWANGRGIDVSEGQGKDSRHIGWIPTPSVPDWALPPPAKAPTSTKQPPKVPPKPVAQGASKRAAQAAEIAEKLADELGPKGESFAVALARLGYLEKDTMAFLRFINKVPTNRDQRSMVLEWLDGDTGRRKYATWAGSSA